MSYIYIDSIGGLDTNDGKTPETAIKTISQLSKIINDIEAGTNILFKRNCQFAGSFVMTKDGIAEQGTHDELIAKIGVYAAMSVGAHE